MLWMTSQNMQSVNSGLLTSGMASSVSLLLRAAMQRSYTVSGGFCQETVSDIATVTLALSNYGFICGIVWVVIQILLNLLVFIAYIPWIISHDPLLPAILICQDHVIFSLLATKNESTRAKIKGISSNIEADMVWPRMDVILRVGESVMSAEDPERGMIVLDKPRMVTSMSYVKTYI